MRARGRAAQSAYHVKSANPRVKKISSKENPAMHKRLLSAAIIAAGAALAVVPALPAAAATPVLTLASVNGPAVQVNDVLAATGTNVSVATTSGGSTGITCNSATLSATVTANPGAGANADENATLTTTGCSSNIAGVTKVNSVTLNNQPYTAAVTSGGVVTVTGNITSTVSLQTVLGAITCSYTASNNANLSPSAPSLDAVAHNVTPANSIVISNNQFTLTTGSGLCPKNGFLSATVGPVTDTTQGGQDVFVSPGQN
jgi:hypothetical protein